MSIHTAVLARFASNLSTPQTIVTVPAGETWIVKDLRVTNSSGSAKQVNIQVSNAGGTVFANLVNASAASLGDAFFSGFVVLAPGDLLVNTSPINNGLTGWISGARLTGVLT